MIKSNNLIEQDLSIIKAKITNINFDSKELKSLLKEFLSRKTKLIRSKIICLFLHAIGENLNEEQYSILTATELIHNASLIHDDVIDKSTIRREKESINEEFSNSLAVISGDYLISQANKIFFELGNIEVLKIFNDAIAKMCISESLQYYNKNKIVSLDEYIQKTKAKTAELFSAGMKSTMLYSNSNLIDDAKNFATNFGIAFQIKNDLDDYRLGVENSNDIKEGIYTAPIILLNSIENNEIAIEKTLNLIDNYCSKARVVLDRCYSSEYKKCLLGILDNLCK